MLVRDALLRTLGHRHQRDHRADADDHAERGQGASQPVGEDGAQGDAKGVEQAQRPATPARTGVGGVPGRAPRSSMIRPSRMRTVRLA